MPLRIFVKRNRADIEAHVRAIPGAPRGRFSLIDLEEWVRNDETLYLWARSEGVRV